MRRISVLPSSEVKRTPKFIAVLLLAALPLAFVVSCGGKHLPSPPSGSRRTPPPKPSGKPGKIFQKGKASWYGPGFHGNRTANGEVYDQYAMTAAHKTLPFNTHVQVYNLDNQKTTVVRINDRGPFIRGRVIDLSRSGARAIDMELAGVANVELRILGQSSTPPATKPDAPKPKLSPVDPEAGPFDVQVGAFGERANAKGLQQRLQQRWGKVHVVRWEDQLSGQVFYRVRVGPLESSHDAQAAKVQLEEEGFDPFVVRHDASEGES